MSIITGNTYPVKDQLKALGGRWNPEQKAWVVPDEKAEQAKALVAAAPVIPRKPNQQSSYRPSRCKDCKCAPSRYNPIYRNGQCKQCWLGDKEERDMGY